MNIGYSCHLLTDDLIDVFIVDGTTHDEVEKQLLKFKESVKIVNTFHLPGKLDMQSKMCILSTINAVEEKSISLSCSFHSQKASKKCIN